MMIPTKLVLAKMLPGKSANTFSIYVDTPENSSAQQTSEVTSCILAVSYTHLRAQESRGLGDVYKRQVLWIWKYFWHKGHLLIMLV